MEGLSNAQLVEFPQSGHGVIAFSTCASDIASSFVAAPRTDLATGCTASLEPDFVTEDEFDAIMASEDGESSTPEATPSNDDNDGGGDTGERG